MADGYGGVCCKPTDVCLGKGMMSAKAEAAKAAKAAEAPAKKPRYEEDAWDDSSKSWNKPSHQEWNASSKKARHEEDDSWGEAWKGDSKKSSPPRRSQARLEIIPPR